MRRKQEIRIREIIAEELAKRERPLTAAAMKFDVPTRSLRRLVRDQVHAS